MRQASRFLLFLLAVAGVLMAVLARPFAVTLIVAAVFAATLSPVHDKLTKWMRGRDKLAAVCIAVGFALVVLAPVIAVSVSLATDLVSLSNTVATKLREGGVDSLLQTLPASTRDVLISITHRFGLDAQTIQSHLGGASTGAVSIARAFLGSLGSGALKSTLMIIALGVFLMEKHTLHQWLVDNVPLPQDQTQEILEALRRASHSAIVANIGTSGVQALAALIGFLIARAPSALFATFVTFVFSLVPGIGAAGVVFFVAALLLLMGKTWAAVFLAVWAAAVVSIVDNVVRPVLMRRGVDMHGALVFFAVLCGLAAFGPAGFILGPLVVTFALTLVRIYGRTREPHNASDA